jgi:hypothetical protein
MPKGLPKDIEDVLHAIGGADGSRSEALASPATGNAVEEWIVQFVKELQDNLTKAGANVTEELANSITGVLDSEEGRWDIVMRLADYYDFVNKGVRGVRDSSKSPGSPYSFKTLAVGQAMAMSIRKWMLRKNIRAFQANRKFKESHRSFEQTGNSAAYALARAIKAKGIRANRFFDDAYDKMIPLLAETISKALAQDVEQVLSQIFIYKGTSREQ